MKLYSEQELKSLIARGHISLCGDSLILDDTYIERDTFVESMRQIINKDTKNKTQMESDNFNEYKKGNGQKKREKIRKK